MIDAQDDRDALEKHAMCSCGHSRVDHHAGNTDPEECYAVVHRSADRDVFCACKRFDPTTGEMFDEDAPRGNGWDFERHCATDLRGADWAGRKLREAQEQLAFNGDQATEECLRIDEEAKRKRDAAWARLERANKPFAKTAAFMENALQVFAETHREELLKGLRTKSRLLPSGVRIGWEKKGGHLRLQETPDAREKLIRWARLRCPGATEQRWEVDAAAAKKHYARTFGRVGAPDGMERVPESEELFVSTGVETKEEP